jgi:hypothetical protein
MTWKESDTNVYSYNAQSLSACQNAEFDSASGGNSSAQFAVPTVRSPSGHTRKVGAIISTAVVVSDLTVVAYLTMTSLKQDI